MDWVVALALRRRVYGPTGRQPCTRGWGVGWADALAHCLAWPADAPLLMSAGTHSIDPLGWMLLPKPNDGRVSVARTRLDGAEVRVVGATHALMLRRKFTLDVE